jgi:hypothetical protein
VAAAIELDHVLIAVADLADAASAFAENHGLISIEGGRHPGWGTANRIVPLGDSYLELIAIVDAREAGENSFGRWVTSGATAAGRPIGWAVRPADLDETARRLGLTPQEGSRMRPDGELIRWRTVGVDEAVGELSLPFFIERTSGARFPGALPAGASPIASVSYLEIDADPEALSTWLGSHSLPIRVRSGGGGIRRVVLAGTSGEIVLGELTNAS